MITSRRARGFLFAVGAVACGLTLLAPPDVTAGERKTLQFLNGGRGVTSLPTTRSVRGDGRAVAPAVQFHGTVRRAGRGGLLVGRRAVQITPDTAIDSIVESHGDALRSPRSLTGRHVTVFGRPVGNGKTIEATLLIVRPEPHELLERPAPPRVDEKWYLDPPGKPARRLRADAPR